MYKQNLFISKMYPKFVALDSFFMWFIAQADRQNLNCWVATILTIVLPRKQNLSNEKKILKSQKSV